MSNILSRILVSTDGSESAEAALTFALALAQRHNSELILCNAVDYVAIASETSVAFGVDLAGTFEDLDEAAREVLAAAAARAKAAGLTANAYKLEGRAADAIISYAIERRVDAIVMGTRGLGGFPHLLLGSTAQGVLRMATVPVFVVHAQHEARTSTGFKTTFVAVDDSDPADAAAAFAGQLALHDQGRLVLENVIDNEEFQEMAARYGGYLQSIHDEWETEAKHLVQTLTEQAQESGVTAIEQRVVFGDPVEEIVSRAEAVNADLIAIGTHGRRGLRRLVMGSVAEGVVRRSRIPVVVVRSFSELNTSDRLKTSGPHRAQLVTV